MIRGFLILGVILVHLWGDIRYSSDRNQIFYVRFGERLVGGEWSRLPTSLIDVIFSGGYLIPSFMMLSGVGLYFSVTKTNGVRDIPSWLMKRMRVLFVPYFFGVAFVAATILAIALLQMAMHGESILYQIKHVTMSKYDVALQGRWAMFASVAVFPRVLKPEWLMVPPGILWFVVLLSQYYVAFPYLYRLMGRLGRPRFLALALIATIAAKVALFAYFGSLDTDMARHMNHVFIPFRWYEFALGMVIGSLMGTRKEELKERISGGAVIVPMLVAGIVLEVMGMFADDRASMTAVFAAPVVISGMALIYLPLLTKQPGRLEATAPALFLATMGPLSYALLIANEPLRLVGSFLRVEEVPTIVWWSFLILYLPLTIMMAKPIARFLGIGPSAAATTPAAAAPPTAEAFPVGVPGGG